MKFIYDLILQPCAAIILAVGVFCFPYNQMLALLFIIPTVLCLLDFFGKKSVAAFSINMVLMFVAIGVLLDVSTAKALGFEVNSLTIVMIFLFAGIGAIRLLVLRGPVLLSAQRSSVESLSIIRRSS